MYMCVCAGYILLASCLLFQPFRAKPYPRTAPLWRVSPLVMASWPSRPGPTLKVENVIEYLLLFAVVCSILIFNISHRYA